jgi:outer membrane protein OmpA-like peptidoglycan-associated protein
MMTSHSVVSRIALAAVVAVSVGLAACKSEPPPPDVEDQLAKELEAQGLLSRKDERGLVLFLPDVLFEFDKADLTEAARTKIHAVSEIVVRLAPERTLSVEGHTDAVGTEEYNLDLSLKRAQSVQTELGTGGVAADKIRSIGHGEKFPVAPNKSAEGKDDPSGRAQNRRVEVVIERGA